MKIFVSEFYLKAHRKLIKKNPHHPSLRLHKLTGLPSQNWSLSITKDIRLLFTYVKEGLLLVNIGTHKEVY